ncbi:FAD binding domain-containing protein [Aeromicrobium sp. CF3.5]|uniref:FAD binding domain-containing protein n=1 Tax=Aeromicrobium sp. CF3.5 TaxID=3373078 RepID=UPI003EE59C83
MKPAPFDFRRPTSLDEALAAYAAEPEAKILAGGQSLIPLLSMRLMTVSELIDINGISELSHIRTDASGVRFGATVRHSELLAHTEARRVQPLIHQGLSLVAHPTIRNRGTTLGSIVHADASAEMPVVLALLGGSVTVASTTGTREIAAEDLYVGPMQSALEHGEIATEAFIPALAPNAGTAYDEVARRHGDYALCGVAVIVTSDEAGALASVRAGYLSVCEVPTVVDLTEAFADGEITDAALAAAGELAVASLDPETDIHASAQYRAQLIRTLTGRVITQAHQACIARRHTTHR